MVENASCSHMQYQTRLKDAYLHKDQKKKIKSGDRWSFRGQGILYWPICAECPLLAIFLDLTASFIRSTSCWYRLRSREAFSLASFSADSKALTLSAVALSRFSSLGSSQRRSALSRTSYKTRIYYFLGISFYRESQPKTLLPLNRQSSRATILSLLKLLVNLIVHQ